jgi:hypothetical protein
MQEKCRYVEKGRSAQMGFQAKSEHRRQEAFSQRCYARQDDNFLRCDVQLICGKQVSCCFHVKRANIALRTNILHWFLFSLFSLLSCVGKTQLIAKRLHCCLLLTVHHFSTKVNLPVLTNYMSSVFI